MTTVLTIHLVRANMSAAVRHNVRLNGTPTEQPGVVAIIARKRRLGWCVLADHPHNPGVSVTNGAELYAEAVCRALDCDISDLAWYQIDSDGNFDELQLLGTSVGFAPLLENGCLPRTYAAFASRAAKLAPGLPDDAAAAVRESLARFPKPFSRFQ